MDELMHAEQSALAPVPAAEKKKKRKLFRGGKKRRWVKVLVILVVVAALVWTFVLRGMGSPAGAGVLYQAVNAEVRDLTTSVSGTATLEPADSYQVTTLVTGEILSAPFEEDDLVEKDALLYTLDSGDAQESVSRAGISVEQAKLQYQQAQEALKPTATISGTISEVYVQNGDSVSAGAELCKIVASTDLTIDFLFPFTATSAFYVGQPATIFIGNFDGSVQGSVVSVSDSTTITSNGLQACSVRVKLENPGIVSDSFTASAVIGSYSSYGNASVTMPASSVVYAMGAGTVNGFTKLSGSTVTKGETLCNLDSESLRDSLESARLNLESAQLSTSSAAENLDSYTIKSPISGTVIEKTFKAGDKVDGVSSGTLAVIYDLSHLKMEMNVSELDIAKVKVGQSVEITCSAVPGKTFTGVVDRVSINGTTTDGFTNYPVTIVLQDYGDLKPGMNVSASIIGETVEDAVSVPVGAVSRGNTVQVALPGALAEDGVTVADPSKVEERAVTLGINDENYIEITSGLEAGETVLMESQTGVMGG